MNLLTNKMKTIFNYKKILVKKANRIRQPIDYLVQHYTIPKQKAKEFMIQPSVISIYWGEDKQGLYVDKSFLETIGYSWNHDKVGFNEALERTNDLRNTCKEYMQKEYGYILDINEIKEKIIDMPPKYRKHLEKVIKVSNYIKSK